jgi:hypothetical protein
MLLHWQQLRWGRFTAALLQTARQAAETPPKAHFSG